ncbi:MAG: lytic transglycosylase domain-containing protein [Syntrophomonadaceae bacterium]|nr:lytic transglycosylase domain-containing protein [Syntrophomonadaceae bacterium]
MARKANRGGKLLLWFILLLMITSLIIFPRWARLFYPLPYQEVVYSYALSNELDPCLVFAVIRTESRFQHDAESAAGASGLMQIMPETGAWIAMKMGQDDFDVSSLQEAETNIAYGCWYLSYLLQEYNGDMCPALAAYNAGSSRVNAWLNEGVWDGERSTLKHIPYEETREYVNKVLNNYEAYRAIY